MTSTPSLPEPSAEALAEHVAEIMPDPHGRIPVPLHPEFQLAALVDAYAEAKDAADAAADRLKDLRDQLLVAHGEILPDEHPLVGTRAVVKVSTVLTWRVDTGRLKSEQPALYAAYARQSSSTKVTVGPR